MLTQCAAVRGRDGPKEPWPCWMAAPRLLLIGTSGADGAMEKVF